MTPTQEQLAIRDSILTGTSSKIFAYAGTGKTSTIAFAAASYHKSSLYFAFNRAAALEARSRFGQACSHVNISTLHAYAMREVGHLYRPRLEVNAWQLRSALRKEYASRLLACVHSEADVDTLLFVIMDVIRAFEYSADSEIIISHFPLAFLKSRLFDLAHQEVLSIASEVWNDLSSPSGTLPISHDTYLKIWQLGHPSIAADVIYFDEFQDASPVMIDILSRQNSQIIVIGDPHQAIYSFRHAIGSIEDFSLPELPLSTSWRFGTEIADVANLILRIKGESRPLIGDGPQGEVVLRGSSFPTAILSRSNAGLVDVALDQLAASRKVAILGGAEPVAASIEAAYNLWLVGYSKHPSFRLFSTWTELEAFAQTSHGGMFRPFIRLVERWGYGIPDLAYRLRKEVVAPSSADVLLSTVHKFKGQQSSVVRLAGDFPAFASSSLSTNGLFDLSSEEANIAYVAITRAQLELQLGAYYEQLRCSLEAATIKNPGFLSVSPSSSDTVSVRPPLPDL